MTSKTKALIHAPHTVQQSDDSVVTQNIFALLGLSDLPDSEKQPILQKMLQIIYQRVVARIMDLVPEDALRQLKLAIDAEDETTATAILDKHGLPPFATMMAEEALFLKYEMDALQRGDPDLAQEV